jgi:hypothetical protein
MIISAAQEKGRDLWIKETEQDAVMRDGIMVWGKYQLGDKSQS